MQTIPPSVGGNVKLDPLDSAVESLAYTNGYITLNGVEPSLGLPNGYTLTQPNSVYYFPVFGISDSYIESRKFTGTDNLVFVNKNLGYNTTNPVYNIDVNGNFKALSAYIENLSAKYIVPSSESNILNFNYSGGVNFNTDVFFNKKTFIKNLTCDTVDVDFLSAKREITTTIYNIFQLTGAYVTHDVIIAGSLTSTNIFATSSVVTPYLSCLSATFTSLTANYATINKTLSVGGDLYASKIYGQIDIDPFSQLYYNNKNQLSLNPNQNYVFAVRPSDEYSTDNINVPRTINGDWWSDFGNNLEDTNVLRPYFKNLQAVFDYIYKNGIIGNNVTVYVDEDIVSGEDKVNYFTTDKSGTYAGCTVTGNLSAGFFSTEWLGSRYPHLTAGGVMGGDFLWGYDSSADISGSFSYINLPPIQFKNITISGRYEINSLVKNNGTLYYSATGRRFNDAPRKISFRTYVCSEYKLPYGTFTNNLSTWKTVKTKTLVQGRQVSFRHDTNLNLNNLCFEFNTNSNDSTGLVFYNGQNTISNISVALLGTGVYTYGALNINSKDTYVQICGNGLGDPTLYTTTNWGNWTYNGYNYETPNYYPGYGLAIIGNSSDTYPTIVNFGNTTAYTGLINVNNGAFLDITDYNIAGKIGRYSYLQSSIILDGKFNANAYFQLGEDCRIQGCEYLFSTNNLAISSKNLTPNNVTVTGLTPSFKLQLIDETANKFNFKYVNFHGSFSTLNINYYGYTNWTFSPKESITTYYQNSFLNIYNGNKLDPNYIFYTTSSPKYIDLTNSLISIGYINKMVQSKYNTDNSMYYVNISDLLKYDDYFKLKSPFNVNNIYTLNYYSSSVR
jgi:hypothetical protein